MELSVWKVTSRVIALFSWKKEHNQVGEGWGLDRNQVLMGAADRGQEPHNLTWSSSFPFMIWRKLIEGECIVDLD